MKRCFIGLVCAALVLACVSPAWAAADPAASVSRPVGLWADESGLLIADDGSNTIYAVADETATAVAGASLGNDVYGQAVNGYQDGPAEEALFASPWAIVPWNEGWAVSDPGNHVIRLILQNQVYTLTGAGTAGSKTGFAPNARFDAPMGLAVDDSGLLYIADAGNGTVFTMTPEGVTATLLEELNQPTGLCWRDGVLYICETGADRVLAWGGANLLTLAGSGENGFADGAASTARFSGPQGVVAGQDGVYVADTGNSAIRLVSDDGLVSTLAVRSDLAGWPLTPVGLALTGDTLYIADPAAQNVLALELGGAAQTEASYADVAADAWYAASVLAMTRRGLLAGTGEGAFEPDTSLTRAMTATILHRYVQSRNQSAILTGEGDFPDVAADAWCAQAVSWCAGAGLVTGYADGTFGPDKAVTRQELAAMLFRLADYLGLEPGGETDLSAFSDGAAVADYARDAMGWAVANGILQGDGTALEPNANATRAQASALLARTLAWLEA